MQQSFIQYYYLRISVEDPIKLLTFRVREVSRNMGFLWSVFPRVWTESDTIGYDTIIEYDSVHIRENTDQRKPAFWDPSRNVANIVTQEFLS